MRERERAGKSERVQAREKEREPEGGRERVTGITVGNILRTHRLRERERAEERERASERERERARGREGESYWH